MRIVGPAIVFWAMVSCFAMQPAISMAEEFIRNLKTAQALIESGQVHSRQSFIDHLDPEFFERVHIIYDSPNLFPKATIEDPSVIVRTKDASVIFTFHGSDEIRLEEWDEETWRIQPAKFIFYPEDQSRKPIIDSRPQYIPFHTTENRPGEYRHVFDTYPDWPGFIGSSHNLYMWLGQKEGAGYLPPFQFEAKALNKYIAEGHPIISRAIFKPIDGVSKAALREFDIPQPSKAVLRIANSYRYFGHGQFGIPLNVAQEFRLLPILSTMNMELGVRMLQMLAKRLARLNMMADRFAIKVSYRSDDRSHVSPIEEAYFKKKQARFKSLVRKYGTALDKKSARNGLIYVHHHPDTKVVAEKDLGGIPLGLTMSANKKLDISGLTNQGKGELKEFYLAALHRLENPRVRKRMIAAIRCVEIAEGSR